VATIQKNLPPVIGQRVQDHNDIFPCFRDLVQVENGALAYRPGQRAVLPHRVAALDEVTAQEIGGGGVIMTRHGEQGAPDVSRHGLDKAGLATARGAFQHERELVAIGMMKHLHFMMDWSIIGSDHQATSAAASVSTSPTGRPDFTNV